MYNVPGQRVARAWRGVVCRRRLTLDSLRATRARFPCHASLAMQCHFTTETVVWMTEMGRERSGKCSWGFRSSLDVGRCLEERRRGDAPCPGLVSDQGRTEGLLGLEAGGGGQGWTGASRVEGRVVGCWAPAAGLLSLPILLCLPAMNNRRAGYLLGGASEGECDEQDDGDRKQRQRQRKQPAKRAKPRSGSTTQKGPSWADTT